MLSDIDKYSDDIEFLFTLYAAELIRLGMQKSSSGKIFTFFQMGIASASDAILADFRRDLTKTVSNAIASAVNISQAKNDVLFKEVAKRAAGKHKSINVAEVLNQKLSGETLSKRIWKIADGFKEQIELTIDLGIREGKSAQEVATQLKKYLNEPDKLFRSVRDEHGELKLSKAAKSYHPGAGVCRSSYQNALRLSRTAMNRSYHLADYERWNQMDFIVGFHVARGSNYPCPLCDSLVGDYPKDFTFLGWHPNCYSDDTEVLTDQGWKLFADLRGERILSLNPQTRDIEYVNYIAHIERDYMGEMIHFYNHSLDMMVTPDHPIFYLNQYTQEANSDKIAKDFSNGNGAFLRTCEYVGNDISLINIGGHTIRFDLFAEFMGYYLADGSVSLKRTNQMFIAASAEKSPDSYSRINTLLGLLPFKFTPVRSGFYMRDADLYKYLLQFGKSPDKYIPGEIKGASRRQIGIFLNAFIRCDGHVRSYKSFIGNRGTVFNSKKQERTYFTTSVKMAADLGELILKTGNRPSYSENKCAGTKHKFSNGIYTINNNNLVIRECYSKTATVFYKEMVPYSGLVYDVQLERNHVMYVRRNGKCVWGSNCMCIATPIISDAPLGHEDQASNGVSTPDKFNNWIADNEERIEAMRERGTLPWFLLENEKYFR